MSFFLVLFLISTMGIIVLILRKLYSLRNIEVNIPLDIDFAIDLPDFEEVGQMLAKKSKKYGYVILVVTIRIYVLTAHATKQYAHKLSNTIKERINKRQIRPSKHKPENKFLKKVSEYKNKIRKIKDTIEIEEGLN